MSDPGTVDTQSLPFSADKQRAVLGYVVCDEKFYSTVISRLEASWFSDPVAAKVFDASKSWWKRWGRMPTMPELLDSESIGRLDPHTAVQARALTAMAKQSRVNYATEPLLSEMEVWIKARLLQIGLPKAINQFNLQKFDESAGALNKLIADYNDVQFMGTGESSFANYREKVLRQEQEVGRGLTFGIEMIDRLLSKQPTGGCLLPGEMTVLMSSVNAGKCHGIGTEIIRADGTLVKVEDINVGDLLMGPDGKPRTVLSTTQGRGPLYRITPKTGGSPWVCNDVHVLSLKRGYDYEPEVRVRKRSPKPLSNGQPRLWSGDVVNIPLNEYLQRSESFKDRMRLWRASLDFSEKPLPIPPYILGLWLGDGHSHTASLTSMDTEISDAWTAWAEGNGDVVHVYHQKENRSRIYAACSAVSGAFRGIQSNLQLRELGVLKNKHIPHVYLTASRCQRLELLAGILDTDGFLSHGNTFEITQKNRRLARDIAYLAGSLGFKVTTTDCNKSDQNGTSGVYVRQMILGPLTTIPVRLARKQAQADGKKNASTTGFMVDSLGEGDYYGFTLDGDHLYLLGDFTVTHNTSCLVTTAVANIAQGKSVLFITHEGTEDELQDKIMRCLTNMTTPEILRAYKDPEKMSIMAAYQDMLGKHLTFVPMNRPGLTSEEVISVINKFQDNRRLATGRGYDLLIDDYPANLQTQSGSKGHMELRHIQAIVYNQFLQLGIQHKMAVLVAVQTNREGSKINRRHGNQKNETRLLVMEDVSEAFGVMHPAAIVITLNRTDEDAANNFLTFLMCKSRSSATGWAVTCKTDYDRCTTHSNTLGSFSYRGSTSISHKAVEAFRDFKGGIVPPEKIRFFEKLAS